MAFNSVSEFLAMGGYAFYVWLSFGVTLFALLGLVLSTRLTRKAMLKEVAARVEREHRIKNAPNLENTL